MQRQEKRKSDIKVINLDNRLLFAIKKNLGWDLFAIYVITPQYNDHNLNLLQQNINFDSILCSNDMKNISVSFLYIRRQNTFRALLMFHKSIFYLTNRNVNEFVDKVDGFISYFSILNATPQPFIINKDQFRKIVFNKFYFLQRIGVFELYREENPLVKISKKEEELSKSHINTSLQNFQIKFPENLTGFLVTLKCSNRTKIPYPKTSDTLSQNILISMAIIGKNGNRFCYKKPMNDIISLLIVIGTIKKRNHLREISHKKTIFSLITKQPFLVPNMPVESSLFNKAVQIFISLAIIWGPHEEKTPLNTIILKEKSQGDIFIGYQKYRGIKALPFYLTLDDLERHTLIVGPSGKGKTRLAMQIAREIVDKKLGNVWIIDFHGEYQYLKEMGFFYITFDDPFNPVGLNIFDTKEDPQDYTYFLSRLYSETLKGTSFEFSPQMEYIFHESLFKTIMEDNKILRNALGFIINLWDSSNQTVKIQMQNTFFALINRLRPLFTGVISPIFWVKKTNLNFEDLIGKNVIFDLSSLVHKGASKRDLIILMNILLKLLFNAFLKKIHDEQTKRTFLVIEEARYIVPWRNRQTAADTSVIEDFAILARKYGLYLITITQSFSSISNDIIENVGTFFLLGADPKAVDIPIIELPEAISASKLPPKNALVFTTTIPGIVHIEINHIPTRVQKKKDDNGEYTTKAAQNVIKKYEPLLLPFDYAVGLIINENLKEKNLKKYLRGSIATSLCTERFQNYTNILNYISLKLSNWLFNQNENKLSSQYFIAIQKAREKPEQFLEIIKPIFLIKERKKLKELLLCVLRRALIISWYGLENNAEQKLLNSKDLEWEMQDLVLNLINQYENNLAPRQEEDN